MLGILNSDTLLELVSQPVPLIISITLSPKRQDLNFNDSNIMPNDKPQMTNEEIAHGNQMAAERTEPEDRETERARADPAPAYKEDASTDPPTYDPKEAEKTPGYDPQPTFQEWMAGGDITSN